MIPQNLCWLTVPREFKKILFSNRYLCGHFNVSRHRIEMRPPLFNLPRVLCYQNDKGARSLLHYMFKNNGKIRLATVGIRNCLHFSREGKSHGAPLALHSCVPKHNVDHA